MAKTITCECGEKVVCDRFTNTCSCGRDYNFAGRKLASREQWGEETGEHWSDVIASDHSYYDDDDYDYDDADRYRDYYGH